MLNKTKNEIKSPGSLDKPNDNILNCKSSKVPAFVEETDARRARQQAVVAALGQTALARSSLDPLLKEAVEKTAEILDVEYTKILELTPDKKHLSLRVGRGWREGLVGNALVDIGEDSQAGYTLKVAREEPVIVEDLANEERFSGPPLLLEHNVRSGISVIIGSPEEPFGVLGAHSTRKRKFSSGDAQFLLSVANIIAVAIKQNERQRNRDLLFEVTEKIRRSESAEALMEQVSNLIGSGFRAARCVFSEVDRAGERLVFCGEFQADGIPPLFKTVKLSEICPDAAAEMTAGHTVINRDTESDERAAALYVAGYKPNDIRSYIVIPLLRDGVWSASLAVTDDEPRFWSHNEVALLETAAERTWLMVEKLRSEMALRNAHEELETRVRKRTRELARANKVLKKENERRHHVEKEREQILKQLAASEERFRAIIDQTAAGICQVDLNNKMTLANKRLCEIFGYDESEIVGKFIRELSHPDDWDESIKLLKHLRETGKPFNMEKRVVRADGSFVWVYMSVSAIRDADGAINSTVSVVIDISEQKRAEEMRSRLASIVESSADAIYSYDLEGHILTWNKSAEKLYGYKKKEIIGQHITKLIPPEKASEPEEIIAAIKKGESFVSFETSRTEKNGMIFDSIMTASPVVDARGKLTAVSVILRDITEQKKTGESLRKTAEKLAETNLDLMIENKERQRMEKERVLLMEKLVTTQEDERRRISRDLHDHVGQQLTALRLNLRLLASSPDQKNLINKIREAEQMAREIDADLHFLARELRPAMLDDLGLSDALVNYVEQWSERFDIKVKIHTYTFRDIELSPEVETNLYRIAQEILNNIVKHSKAHQVSVLFGRSNGEALLIIEDNGIGFDPDKKALQKSGLGLIGIRERATLVGGNIEIESASGRGTTVYVRVPLERSGGGTKK